MDIHWISMGYPWDKLCPLGELRQTTGRPRAESALQTTSQKYPSKKISILGKKLLAQWTSCRNGDQQNK